MGEKASPSESHVQSELSSLRANQKFLVWALILLVWFEIFERLPTLSEDAEIVVSKSNSSITAALIGAIVPPPIRGSTTEGGVQFVEELEVEEEIAELEEEMEVAQKNTEKTEKKKTPNPTTKPATKAPKPAPAPANKAPTPAPVSPPAPVPAPAPGVVRKVYSCGYAFSRPIAQLLFSDFRYVSGNDRAEATKDDVLVAAMHGRCQGKPGLGMFPGKVILMNPENFPDSNAKKFTLSGRQRGEDIWRMGGVKEDPEAHHILGYFMVFQIFVEDYRKDPEKAVRELVDPQYKPKNTGKFNGITYAQRVCKPHREKAVAAIAQIMPVYIGGSCKAGKVQPNNMNLPPGEYLTMEDKGSRNSYNKNAERYKDYKFCIAMENVDKPKPGYITEKIYYAFKGGCIPVYWGSEEVFDVFNKDAFVWYNPKDPAPALELLGELHLNETRYQEMLNQPMLADGRNTLKKYFSIADGIEGGFEKNRIRSVMGIQ